jgi:hypothetical protein
LGAAAAGQVFVFKEVENLISKLIREADLEKK